MIYMIKTKQRLIDVPEGLPSLLLETIDFVCVTPAAHDFATENLTVQALYIKSCLTNDPSGKPNPEILLMHLRYCVATIREYK